MHPVAISLNTIKPYVKRTYASGEKKKKKKENEMTNVSVESERNKKKKKQMRILAVGFYIDGDSHPQ